MSAADNSNIKLDIQPSAGRGCLQAHEVTEPRSTNSLSCVSIYWLRIVEASVLQKLQRRFGGCRANQQIVVSAGDFDKRRILSRPTTLRRHDSIDVGVDRTDFDSIRKAKLSNKATVFIGNLF